MMWVALTTVAVVGGGKLAKMGDTVLVKLTGSNDRLGMELKKGRIQDNSGFLA